MSFYCHPSSYVDDGAEIGERTKIWHFSHVMPGARIGADCILGQNVHVADHVVVGAGVKIQNNVSLYAGTEIEDFVFLGPSCVLTHVINPRSEINRHQLYQRILVRRGATVGANATIVCGVTIGRYAFVAAGAVVARDVPNYALMAGVPARRRGWMSRHAQKLLAPDRNGIMICPESGFRYREEQAEQLCCLDLDEEQPLPENMRIGKQEYAR